MASSLIWGLSWGCSSASQGSGPQAAAIAASRVQNQGNPYRPWLTLVERDGDPRRGLAVAVHVGGPAHSAVALAMLLEGRMRGAGFPTAVAHSSPSGFIVYALADEPGSVAQFIQVANVALTTPVAATDVERVTARWRSAPPRVASSDSEAALAQCSGELVLAPSIDGPATFATRLGPWLDGVAVGDVALAVVGSREHLDAAAAALAGLAPWTRLGASGSAALAPNPIGSVPGIAGHSALSVAVWGAGAAPATASAERLGEPDSMLALRLGAGFPAWQVARVVSNLNREGACLRVDLQASGAAPSAKAVARSAADVLDELGQTLARVKPGPWVVAKQVLAMEAPEQAAAVAAWQALNAPAATAGSGALRSIVHYAGPYATGASADSLAQLVQAASEDAPQPQTEFKRGVEAGQGKFWMLLATPCGTSGEDAMTAGTLALALQSSALAFDGRSGVTLEPWIHVDAMGILAHATAVAPHESPAAQAERVAEGVARALLSGGPPPDAIVRARELLLSELTDGPAPALSLALRQSSANHPSWLDARGIWSTLTAISVRSVQLQRASFLRGKLRVASLGNHDAAQLDAGERRLLRLLGSADAGQGECVPRRIAAPVPGKYRIETTGADADAIISIPLPVSPRGLSDEAVWTELLMNRPGGWLSQALLRPGLVSTARARALGGAGAAALVIEIHAVEGKREEAVAQVRGLLDRLRAGAASSIDAQNAQDFVARHDAQRQLNPRGRLVDLWYGSPRPAATLESLRAMHRVAFEAGREVVVLTDTSD